jgi:chitinase
MKRLIFFCLLGAHLLTNAQSTNRPISVIGYYAGDAVKINAYPIEKLSHIIFSFCHLKGNKLNVDNNRDTLTIKKLVELKSRNPKMKVILSLGGWTGCETCSPVFATEANRIEFAKSVKQLNDYFHTDGIDLDWEYPAIPGPPGHPYMPADRENFTDLVKQLRKELGSKHEISFAAGGSQEFLEKSIDWKAVSPMVDKINLMTYDLVHGNSTVRQPHSTLLNP